MQILFFGRLSEVAQNMSIDKPDGVSDIEGLKLWLSGQDEALSSALARAGNRVAVNKVMTTGNVPLGHEDEVAFMSPLSGG